MDGLAAEMVTTKMQRAARVGKGRRAEDPDIPGKPPSHCRSSDLEVVLALLLRFELAVPKLGAFQYFR